MYQVDARQPTATSLQKVQETKHRLEVVHGKGLVGLYDNKGKFQASRLSSDRRRVNQMWTIVGNRQFDAEAFESLFYGLSYGLQYNGLSAIDSVSESNCFYATYGLVSTFNQLAYDWENIQQFSGSYNWFNIALYDPLHITSNFSVVYE